MAVSCIRFIQISNRSYFKCKKSICSLSFKIMEEILMNKALDSRNALIVCQYEKAT